jgi:hypothetical protein
MNKTDVKQPIAGVLVCPGYLPAIDLTRSA